MSTHDFSTGMDLGVYAFCMLMARNQEVWQWEAKDFERFAEMIASQIEASTGFPAEDVALNLMPLLVAAMSKIRSE